MTLPKIHIDIFNNLRTFFVFQNRFNFSLLESNHTTLIESALTSLKHNEQIYNLFHLVYFVKYLISRSSDSIYSIHYFNYCEILQHPTLINSFDEFRNYNVLVINNTNITNSLKEPLEAILKSLYPKSHFNISNQFNTSIDRITDIHSFINYCNLHNNYYDFVILDAQTKCQSFNHDEQLLIYFCYIMNILKSNGSCIIKFETPKHPTDKLIKFEILSLLSNAFQEVTLINPTCDKTYNPSYYLLCKSIQKTFYRQKYMNLSLSLYQNIIFKDTNKRVYSFLSCLIPLYYRNKVNDILNQIIFEYLDCLQQIYNYHIHFDKTKIDQQLKKRMLKAKHWITNYSVVHKNAYQSLQCEEIKQVMIEMINVLEICND